MPTDPVAVYVHIPFCPSKCGYCDFNSYAMEGDVIDRTVRAIVTEIRRSRQKGRPAKTVFFGGGTPTFISEPQILSILEAVFETHPPIEGAEITSEANPGTADITKFVAMRRGGFNRMSLGAQSFSNSDLLTLGRVHRSDEIGRAFSVAREAGFDNLNLDLMFGLPGQDGTGWHRNLDTALALAPEHLSLYCLTIEPNTAFYRLQLKGQLDLPDDDVQVAMYEDSVARAAAGGLEQYEISNFSKPGFECRHNLCYWDAEEYMGYGPGAVGSTETEFGRIRYTNLKHPDGYCKAIELNLPLSCDSEILTDEMRRTERIMLGLRLNRGLPIGEVLLKHQAIDKVVAKGWAEIDGETMRLTPQGRHFCSEVALELI